MSENRAGSEQVLAPAPDGQHDQIGETASPAAGAGPSDLPKQSNDGFPTLSTCGDHTSSAASATSSQKTKINLISSSSNDTAHQAKSDQAKIVKKQTTVGNRKRSTPSDRQRTPRSAKRKKTEQKLTEHTMSVIALASIPHSVQIKIESMRRFCALTDTQAGITYSSIDHNGSGDLKRVRIPGRDFIGALKILAVDLNLEHPDKIGRAQAEEMAQFELTTHSTPPHKLEWALIDFAKSSELERRAQALLKGLGFQERSIIGVQCCMQAFQQTLRLATGVPTLDFRPDLSVEDAVDSKLSSWSDAQLQSEREVAAVTNAMNKELADKKPS